MMAPCLVETIEKVLLNIQFVFSYMSTDCQFPHHDLQAFNFVTFRMIKDGNVCSSCLKLRLLSVMPQAENHIML